jgi:hypothetical protein
VSKRVGSDERCEIMRPLTCDRAQFLAILAKTNRTFLLLLPFVFACLQTTRITEGQQVDVGFILGTVSDQTGAAIVGARITITSQSTGLSQDVVTNQRGEYTSLPLLVGRYNVLAAKDGFISGTVQNIIVDVAAHVQTNLTLKVGSTTANVTVEATPPPIDTTDPEIATTIDRRDTGTLPLNGRVAMALATLTPGAISAMGAVFEGFENRGGEISEFRISGGPDGYNNNILDGVTNLQNYLGEIAINLKPDAVQEFRTLTGIVPAQFGYFAGGVVDIVTRSGTDKLHGSVYNFFRNDALDASVAYPRPFYGKQETRFNNYGGTLGGPVMRNKVYYFGNFEGNQYRSRVPFYTTVPTAQEYQGNFSDFGILNATTGACTPVNIYDADTLNSSGQREQFAYNNVSNEIPAGRLDPVALAYDKLFYPLPNNTSGSYNSCTHANDLLVAVPLVVGENQGIVRGDDKINDNDSIFARYAAYEFNTNNAPSASGLPGSYSERNDETRNQAAVLSETHVFNPTMVNNARIGGVLGDFSFRTATAGMNVPSTIDLPNVPNLQSPEFINGIANGAAPNVILGFRSTLTMEGDDDLRLIRNKQTLSIGASARFTEGFNYQTGSSVAGNYTFSAVTTGEGNNTSVITGTGSQFASYLLGQVYQANVPVYAGAAFRRMMYALYAQDDWRASPRLTINAGLRWDYVTQAVEKHNGIENFDITKVNPVNGFLGTIEYANYDGNGRNFVAENYGDVGPRLGFAYSIDNSTVLRGGAAIYYPSLANYAYGNSSGSTLGYSLQTTTVTNPTANGYAFHLQSGFPATILQPLGVSGGQNAFLGQTATYVSPIAKDPSSQQFTLTLSRSLPGNVAVDASYVGNHGNHFITALAGSASFNMNTLSPQYFSMGTAALSAQVPNPNAGKVPGSLGAATLTEKQVLLPFNYMNSVSGYYRNGSYWANLGTLLIQRRVEHGLEILGTYAFGKTTDEGISSVSDLAGTGLSTGNTPQNWRNLRGEHSLDTLDITHRLTVAALYDLPFGTGHRILDSPHVTGVASGWQYITIFTLQSGFPIAVTGATNQGIATRPNLDPTQTINLPHPSRANLYRTGRMQWFNPAAFLDPQDYSFGDVPRYFGSVFGPGTENFDMSLVKTTHISERAMLEIRLETFDTLNHDNLGSVNTSFVAGPSPYTANPTLEGGLNTNVNFGAITSSGAERNLELSAKISF